MFYRSVDRQSALCLNSNRHHRRRYSPCQTFDTPRAGYESVQHLSSNPFEWSWAKVKTTTPRCHYWVTYSKYEVLLWSFSRNKIFFHVYLNNYFVFLCLNLFYSRPNMIYQSFFLRVYSPLAVSYPRKTFHLTCLTGFCIRVWICAKLWFKYF